MKEIEIVGGGLAGLSLGIGLRRAGVSVWVREATNYPRHRVCGEFVNGVTWRTLERLGIAGLFVGALRHERTKWWMGEELILNAKLEKAALGMSRWEMDEKLRLEFLRLGGRLTVNDRVGVDGREGLVWGAGRLMRKRSECFGLKGHFEGVEVDGCLEMHLGEGAYVGLTPISDGGGRVNVCGLFRMNKTVGEGNRIVRTLRGAGLEGLADRLAEARMLENSLTGITGIELGRQSREDGLLTLGDAERMIPPFTGNGMSMAFEAAESALDPLVSYASGDETWVECRARVAEALEARFSQRVVLALWMQRAISTRAGRVLLRGAARAGVLPFHWLHRQLT